MPLSPPTARARLLVVATVVSLAAAAFAPTAGADEDPRSPASLDVDIQGDSGFTYQMSTVDTHRQTTGEFDMEEFRLNVSYASSNASETLRKVNASLVLEGIYEFRDLNDNGRFDLGDRVVRFVPVEPSRWASVDHVQTKGLLEIIRVSTPLEGDGEVQLDILLSPETIRLSSDRTLRPLDNKIDILLQGIQTSAEDTQFSLAMRLESGHLDKTEAHAVRVKGDGANLLYRWSDTAVRDGISTPLKSTLVEQAVNREGQDRTELVVVHALEPGNRIELSNGFEVEETSSTLPEAFTGIVGNPLVYLGGLLAAVIVVGGNAWRKLQDSEGGSGRLDRFSQK